MRTFRAAFRSEARQRIGSLGTAAFVVALLDAFIAWQVRAPNLQALVASLVAGSLALYWVFGGLGVFPARTPTRARGATLVLVKYAWLLVELVALTFLLLGSAAYFLSGVVPLGEVSLAPRTLLLLGVTLACALLVPPAIGLAASAIGRSSRWSLLSAFLAFVLLWWAFWLLLDAASTVESLGWMTFHFAQLPFEVCAAETGCFVRVNAALVLLQPVFAVALLWLASRSLNPRPENLEAHA
ncbi:hypothetical protein [Deinococcus yavapaiensis]|uniref:Uncharacterized protein n=1 Tax=Deinococcus yavapaiensis KR-236 TaxID=694435 RepID=A0A318S3W4_9DEIO|nr:hypothetical protein [Deinococcus yavapaiensis]PYE51137.1 hypothetical protein DES52_11569 [Deinococcus yavapaiensis KR-236]